MKKNHSKFLLLALTIAVLILSSVSVQAYDNEEVFLNIGETYSAYKNGERYDIKIVSIGEDNKVLFTVNGEYEDLYEEGEEKFSELDVYADIIQYDEGDASNSYVKLVLNKEEPITEIEIDSTTTPSSGGSGGGPGGISSTATPIPNYKNCAREGQWINPSTGSQLQCCKGLKAFYATGALGEAGLCYNPSIGKGKPVCKYIGTRSEGWYYDYGIKDIAREKAVERVLEAETSPEAETTSGSGGGASSTATGITSSNEEGISGISSNTDSGGSVTITSTSHSSPAYRLLVHTDCDNSNNQGNNCKDSDGANVYKKGTVYYKNGGSNTDTCIEKTDNGWGNIVKRSKYLVEYSCQSSSNYGKAIYYCRNGCVDGACVKTQIAPQPVGYDLSDYPKFFLAVDGSLKPRIVVGDTGSATDVMVVMDIATSLQSIETSQNSGGTTTSQTVSVVQTGTGVLSSEISNPLSENLISVGSPCVNEVSFELMDRPEDCNAYINEGESIIRLLSNKGYMQLVVYGYNDADIKVAGDILANWEDYNLQGTFIKVITATGKIIILEDEEILDEISYDEADVDLFIMSDCPYAKKALISFETILETFPNINFDINYIAEYLGNRKFNSLHGDYEAEEDIRQLCAKEINKDKYFDYILCRTKQGIRAVPWEACAEKTGFDLSVLDDCTQGDKGKDLLSTNLKIAEKLGIRGSPTWLINGHKLSGITYEEIKANLCKYTTLCGNNIDTVAEEATPDYRLEEVLDAELEYEGELIEVDEDDFLSESKTGTAIIPSIRSCSNGCFLGGTCIPFKTRLIDNEVPKYCDITKDILPQKEAKVACQNSEECRSNQCYNEVCGDLSREISAFRKFLSKFLKGIFG